MMTNFFAEIPKDAFDLLTNLKSQIENADLENEEMKLLLKEYYEELSDIWFWVTDPLPSECVLNNILMPEYYLEFIHEYEELGPNTLLTFCQKAEIIAEIKVIKIKMNPPKILYSIKDLIKADLKQINLFPENTMEISIGTGLMKPKFYRNEEILIFVPKSKGEYWIPTSNFVFRIHSLNDEKHVEIPFWHKSFFKGIDLQYSIQNNNIFIPYSSLKLWLKDNKYLFS